MIAEAPTRVVILDHDDRSRLVLGTWLANCGFEVWPAGTAALAQRHLAQLWSADAMLAAFDVHDDSNLAVVRRARSTHPRMLIVVTAPTMDEPERERATAAGADVAVARGSLLKTLDAILASWQRHAGASVRG